MSELKHFVSPDTETSVLKGIPNTDHWHHVFGTAWINFRNHCRLSTEDVTHWKRYRGPRISGNEYDCKKEDGYSFSVYIRTKRYWQNKYEDIVIVLADEMKRGGFYETDESEVNMFDWIRETRDNFDGYEVVNCFPNFHLYSKYAVDLQNYFADRAQPGHRQMFLNFIKETE